MALQFGIGNDEINRPILESTRVSTGKGQILAILGPSGSGKSSMLTQLCVRFPKGILVQQVTFPDDRPILDSVAVAEPLPEVLSLLTLCGLGEPRSWLRSFNALSEGEKFRARLARAIGLHLQDPTATPLMCDEFCSGLHDRVSRAMAHNLRKLTTRRGLNVIVAACRDEVLPDLQPDAVIRLTGFGSSTATHHRPEPRPLALIDRLEIERGTKRDYQAFADMHYRRTDELGFVDSVFVLREKPGNEAVGIVVYAHSPLELMLRNRATQGLFKRNPERLNRDLRILRRLVIHPDVRGCGLGHHLVRATLAQVGTPFVECLAAMGAVNPVFERAGMSRIGRCGLTAAQRSALKQVQNCGVDPMAREFAALVARRPRLRRIVTDLVAQWYEATTSAAKTRIPHQSPQFLARTFRGLIASRPVYYLWHKDGRKFEPVNDEDEVRSQK